MTLSQLLKKLPEGPKGHIVIKILDNIQISKLENNTLFFLRFKNK